MKSEWFSMTDGVRSPLGQKYTKKKIFFKPVTSLFVAVMWPFQFFFWSVIASLQMGDMMKSQEWLFLVTSRLIKGSLAMTEPAGREKNLL